MKRGLIVGKFYPPHAGHHYLISTGQANCDELTVLVCNRPEHMIPGKLRAQWIRKEHPGVTVRVINDKLDDNDSPAWAKFALKEMKGKLDVVFTSETYGERWAKAIGCEHHLVDMERCKLPVSGTMVRDDPFKAWDFLTPDVRGYFALRICVVGAESTGKTTLSKALAQYYNTEWVPEYGRLYTEKYVKDVWNYTWKTEDFEIIAKRQAQLEDATAKKANKVLICDTDVFATSIWHKRYMGYRSVAVEELAVKRPTINLYIMPDINTPFDQDGIRDGEEIRTWMDGVFVDSLALWGKNYIRVSGSPEARLAQATKAIDALLKKGTGVSGKEITL